ncbi:MAG: hypothetical protein SGJ00_08565 [bacterium]|nr:hypothetical protein [bacterium]
MIKNGQGKDTGIFVPIQDWNTIIEKHEDLKELVEIKKSPKIKLSKLAGKLSVDTPKSMQKNILESRNEWGSRINKQF